jgi:hypothetical protein
MNYGPNNIGDLSNNMYAAIMKYLAEGLSGWSIFVLVPFLMSQIVTNNSASLISLKAVMVIIVGVTIFAIAAESIPVLVEIPKRLRWRVHATATSFDFPVLSVSVCKAARNSGRWR